MKIPVELICIEADMPYFTDDERSVYYVLSSVNNNQHSLLPIKVDKGALMKVGGFFNMDYTLPTACRNDRSYRLKNVYLVEALPALKDIRHSLYYPPIIGIRIENLKCDDILQILSTEYITYGNRVFVSSAQIEGADVNSFSMYTDSLHSKDKNRVYYRDKAIKKANPETFEIISPQFQKDDAHVWYMGSLLYADSQTFRVFTCEKTNFPDNRMSLYACDKNYVFYQYLILDDADLKTFRVLRSAKSDELYGVDERRVFYHHMYLEYADAKTFRVVSENERLLIDHPEVDAYDINYKYTCGNRIPITEKERNLLFSDCV